MSKIEYQYTPITTQAEPAPKPDRLPPVSYHARAALLIGMFVFTAILAIGWVFELSWQGILKAAVILAVLSAGAFGILWTWIATTHDWRMDTAERRRRWRREDAPFPVIDNAPLPSAPTRGEKVDRLARIILERQYLDGLPATREACEADGLCTQDEWNVVNTVMKKLDIKGAKDFKVTSYDEALTIWRVQTRVEQGAILIWDGGSGWDRIPL